MGCKAERERFACQPQHEEAVLAMCEEGGISVPCGVEGCTLEFTLGVLAVLDRAAHNPSMDMCTLHRHFIRVLQFSKSGEA